MISKMVTLLLLLLSLSMIAEVGSSTPAHLHKIKLTLTGNYVYYAHLHFGSHYQEMEMLLDTGSRTMAIFCDTCHKGCIKEKEFKTKHSTSFRNMTCEWSWDYSKKIGYKDHAIQECLLECQD